MGSDLRQNTDLNKIPSSQLLYKKSAKHIMDKNIRAIQQMLIEINPTKRNEMFNSTQLVKKTHLMFRRNFG